jgi:hypothetical protein
VADDDRKGKKREDEPNPEYENFQRFLEGTVSIPREGDGASRSGFV